MGVNRRAIFNKSGGVCVYCGCVLDINDFHIDHHIPKSKGGKISGNAVPSCPRCNLAKSDLTIEEFRTKIRDYRDTHIGTVLGKYYGFRNDDVIFWFEKEGVDIGSL